MIEGRRVVACPSGVTARRREAPANDSRRLLARSGKVCLDTARLSPLQPRLREGVQFRHRQTGSEHQAVERILRPSPAIRPDRLHRHESILQDPHRRTPRETQSDKNQSDNSISSKLHKIQPENRSDFLQARHAPKPITWHAPVWFCRRRDRPPDG